MASKRLQAKLERLFKTGKLKRYVPRRSPGEWAAFNAEYREACKYAARDKRGTIDIFALPEKFHEHHKKLVKKRRRVQKECRIRNLDIKVYLNKYYPWCYRAYIPTMVLQGFYSVKYAKKKYRLTYGNDSLKYIKFIKGQTALEKGFKVGETLYINGKWIKPMSRVIKIPEARALNQSRSYRRAIKEGLKEGSSKYEEKQLVEKMDQLTYGRKPIRRIKSSERDKLQKIQEINRRRKASLFEE